ncbi:MAG: hypothetical protein DME98_02070 [Verrucomicrobia bacterium]|nr:MAG: hypothetical protein DME98_02070 [Verrucomicrobiota bacterium]
MTTADIMFAQPGNPESLRDHEYDARTISWALLAAILIHLVVAFLLAAFSGVFSPSVPFEEKPAELTFPRAEGEDLRIKRQLNWSKRACCGW